MYYLSDYDGIDERHKCKYEFTMDSGFIQRQIEGFLRNISGGVVIDVQALFFSSVRRALVKLRKEYGFKIVACLHSNPRGLISERRHGLMSSLKEIARVALRRTVGDAIRLMYECSDCFVLLSRAFENEMSYYFHIDARKGYEVIGNPLTFHQFATIDDISKKENVVLIVSRLHESPKNLKAAFRIWKKIENSGLAPEWTLRLAGHGCDEKEILDYARLLDLKQFVFLGRTNNPLPLYQEASLFMMTSRCEGFGVTLTESLQNGVVPIAFNSFSAVQDIIEDGVNGFLINPYDEETYAERLLDLMTNRDKREKMAIAGGERVKKFKIDYIGKEWERLFQNIN